MSLTDIPYKVGIFTEDTDRGVGKLLYWKDCDHVRFFNGHPQKIGGWLKASQTRFLGKARSVIDWATTRQEFLIAIGTNKKLYVFSGGEIYDITPIRASGTLTDPYATTDGSLIVTVTDTAHVVNAGDFVHFDTGDAVGGITISGEYEVTSVIDVDTYTITHTVAATSTTTGGGSVDYRYEIPIGAEYDVAGLGWGALLWGGSTWGTPRVDSESRLRARIWSFGIWGEDLIASPYGRPMYVWDSSAGVTTRAVLISQAPSVNLGVFVSQEERQILSLGSYEDAAHDPQLIRWCSQEDYTDWTPTLANTAGNKRLELGTEILVAVATRTEALVFTNTAMYAMQFVGMPDVYGFQPIGLNGGIAGARAVNIFNGVAYWMAAGGFYRYDGTIVELPCAVYDYVFKNINRDVLRSVQCAVITDYSEILWLYASNDSQEINRYVIYNTTDSSWYFGSFDRTAYAGATQNSIRVYGCGTDGYLYDHEIGINADTNAMHSYLHSGDIEIDAGGEQLMRIGKFIADMLRISGSINISFSGKKYPQAVEVLESGPFVVDSSTEYVNPSIRCRQVSFQVDSNSINSDWRLGLVRIDVNPDGKR
jgi:hypothetical protein